MVGWTVGGGARGSSGQPAKPSDLPLTGDHMKVIIDDVWSSPSTLHVRVTLHDDEGRWRHRYYPTVPLSQVPIEALAPLIAYFKDPTHDPLEGDVPLF